MNIAHYYFKKSEAVEDKHEEVSVEGTQHGTKPAITPDTDTAAVSTGRVTQYRHVQVIPIWKV